MAFPYRFFPQHLRHFTDRCYRTLVIASRRACPWRWHSDLGGVPPLPLTDERGLTHCLSASVIGINLLYRSVETAGIPKSSCSVGIPRLNYQQEILASVLSNNSQVTLVRFSCE